jgi:hypothetical protein
MKERRKLERFDLQLPAEIEVERGKKHIRNLFTKNICAGGAFFETSNPLPLNTNVKIDLVAPTRVQIIVLGAVCRSDPSGMAVQFEEEYKILPLAQA